MTTYEMISKLKKNDMGSSGSCTLRETYTVAEQHGTDPKLVYSEEEKRKVCSNCRALLC